MPNTLQFGSNIDPSTDALDDAFEHARIADETGLDLITIQDHPYQRKFLDTWTLLTYLAAKTQRVRLGTNVANLPLRPPAMLAKSVATLDVLSGGRAELGLGAGAFWNGVRAFGGQERTPAEAFTAFKEALQILRGMWANAGRSFTLKGEIYEVVGAQPGPAPLHRIPIWAGASRPKMMRLIGQMADGVLVSRPYEPPERLLEINRQIDEGAAEAGRTPDDIRRGYNLMGVIVPQKNAPRPAGLQPGVMYGGTQDWIEELTRLNQEYRQDTFLFWAAGDDATDQIRRFALEVAPAVKAAVTV